MPSAKPKTVSRLNRQVCEFSWWAMLERLEDRLAEMLVERAARIGAMDRPGPLATLQSD